MAESNPFIFVGAVIAVLYIITILFLLFSALRGKVNGEHLTGAMIFLVLPLIALYIGYKLTKRKERLEQRP